MNDYTPPYPTDDTHKKRCTRCQEWKLATPEYFYRHKKSVDGYYPQCKVCKDGYRHTTKGKEVTKRKNDNWRKTENGVAFLRAKSQRRQVELDPQKIGARQSVNNAVHTGRLQPIKSCACLMCGNQAQEYHHWSYDTEYWLDVIPLCQPCHTSVHASNE